MFGQGEMQQLRDKLSIADRAAKSEAQLKVEFSHAGSVSSGSSILLTRFEINLTELTVQ